MPSKVYLHNDREINHKLMYRAFSSKSACSNHNTNVVFRDTDIVVSVTIFGQISPLGCKVKKLWPSWFGSICICLHFELTLANFIVYWRNFHCCEWPNIDMQSTYLVTLIVVYTMREHVNTMHQNLNSGIAWKIWAIFLCQCQSISLTY